MENETERSEKRFFNNPYTGVKRKPVKVLYNVGWGDGVTIAFWPTENGKGYKISISKTYTDKEGKKATSHSFFPKDLPAIMSLCQEAIIYINNQHHYKKNALVKMGEQEVIDGEIQDLTNIEPITSGGDKVIPSQTDDIPF